MVFFLLEPKELQKVLQLAKEANGEVWLGSDAMSHDEHKELCSAGHKITRFAYALSGATPEVVEDALATIEEHHPNQLIWVQHVAKS